jgi:two-component system nitrate/nitrite response regulator NarL
MRPLQEKMPAQQIPIAVVLAQFEDLFARGLRQLLDSDSGLAVVAAGLEHERLGVVLRAHSPDVAILDAGALASLTKVRELSREHPSTHLIVLVNDRLTAESAQLLAFGASACLSRRTESRDVLNAIYLASRGLHVFPRTTAEQRNAPASGGLPLTRREAEVLNLLRRGQSNAQIALALRVGIETVRTQARSIYRKLGVSSRRELAG